MCAWLGPSRQAAIAAGDARNKVEYVYESLSRPIMPVALCRDTSPSGKFFTVSTVTPARATVNAWPYHQKSVPRESTVLSLYDVQCVLCGLVQIALCVLEHRAYYLR